jgi:F1F0 ATPase subunit 2
MSDLPMLAMALTAGAFLGVFFFAGLWWTLRIGLRANNAALFIVLSSQLRTAAVVIGFYFIGRGDWHMLVTAVFGFFLARMMIALWQNKSAAAPIRLSPRLPPIPNDRSA